METNIGCVKLWCEWRSWALPLRIGAMGDYTAFEIHVGPFGLTILR
jgi:hypothetical protein